MVFFHGRFRISIDRAYDLPNVEIVGRVASLIKHVSKSAARSLLKAVGNTSDPYVKVVAGQARLARTAVIWDNENPVWGEIFDIDIAHEASLIDFAVLDAERLGLSVPIGHVRIEAGLLAKQLQVSGTFSLVRHPHLHLKGWSRLTEVGPRLKFSIEYIPLKQLGPGADTLIAPATYFPCRDNCKVTLYQDAHCPIGMLPNIVMEGGVRYQQPSCWDDLSSAIDNAKHFIYITGWSLWVKEKLKPDVNAPCLGDLLIAKAESGVRVCLLVWDDQTSVGWFTKGVMDTADEEARRTFAKTKVKCKLVARPSEPEYRSTMEIFGAAIFTHHQKSVICDAPGEAGDGELRSIVAFLGGLDLTTGRFDYPMHPVFTETGEKRVQVCPDFYNKCIAGATPSIGLRQPWHDTHAKVEGEAAWDVATNFSERWAVQASDDVDSLCTLSDEKIFVQRNQAEQLDVGPSRWTVQVLRSIDSHAAMLVLDTSELNKHHGTIVDASIHRAYVHHIRRAKNFLYIENQYFIGASHCWRKANANSVNLIPVEITEKIVDKIRNGERFSAYIVIPLFPEGIPTSGVAQEILHLQAETMSFMFGRIARVLRECGSAGHPVDYLRFYCLVNREGGKAKMPEGLKSGPLKHALEHKRHMVYVHSKLMVVDDEVVIVGSANINERSMAGIRDTEIAIAAHQPEHIATHSNTPRAEVYAFRMSLWAEHFGTVDEAFDAPSSQLCLSKTSEIASRNWKIYTAERNEDMTGHIVPYPISVSSRGHVHALPNFKKIPDLGGNILGRALKFKSKHRVMCS